MKTPTVSIIIPCLNEEKAIRACVKEARQITDNRKQKTKIRTEIIVVDNGSTDKSRAVAKKAGAKVIIEPRKGYGRALLTGLQKAKGEILVFADGDGSYDFREAPKLIEKLVLRTGPVAQQPQKFSHKGTPILGLPVGCHPHIASSPYDLVVGSRLLGKVEKDAMPFWHRYVGTPILNRLFSLFFKERISDVNSGFRAITRQAFAKLKIYSTGMEFASEMLYKSCKAGLRIVEVPITYKKRIGQSKLSAFRDAWRHLKFMLLFSPGWLFVLPGLAWGVLGGLGMLWLLPGKQYFLGRFFDIHTMTVCSFLLLAGFQLVFLGLFAKVFSVNFLQEEDKKTVGLMKIFTLEKGIASGGILGGLGMLGFLGVLREWLATGFGPLSQERLLLFSLTLMFLGIEIIFSSFFFGILGREER